jgi:hypothetical protein
MPDESERKPQPRSQGPGMTSSAREKRLTSSTPDEISHREPSIVDILHIEMREVSERAKSDVYTIHSSLIEVVVLIIRQLCRISQL